MFVDHRNIIKYERRHGALFFFKKDQSREIRERALKENC